MEQTQINPLNLITFGKSITRPEAIETMPAVNLMAMLQNGQWRKPIEAIRKEKNPILQKEMKLRLPYFVYGVLEGARSEGNVRQVNGIVFDFDHVGEIIPAKQKLMGAAPWFRWLFRSPVDGLKLMIPFSRPVTDKAEYLMIWNLLKAEIEAKSGFQADNTPDLCRACFLSWDDDVIFAPDDFQMDLDFYLNDSEQIRLREADKKKRDRKTETQRDREQKENGVRAGANIGNAGPKQYGTPVLTGRTAGFIRCGDDCGPAVTRDGNDSQMNLADRPDESGVPIPRQPGVRKRKVDVPVNQAPQELRFPQGVGEEDMAKPSGLLVDEDVDLPGKDVNLPKPTLADFPELLDLFRRPQNIHLDRDQLPREIVVYLDLVGRITDAQDGAKLTAFLPVVAANIGNRVYMYNAGTRHYCNIWAAIIGPSTVSRKTTVINQAMKMLQPFKETLRELSPKERNEQDIELSRVTQARLYNLLAINPNRLILQMELSAWMREMGKSYNAGMKQEITDMFDGKDRSIAKMEIDEHIAKPAFSIVGATTEDWFFQELREVADQRGGFLQRFIICIIQNIDVNELRLASVDASDCDRELADWDEMLAVFRSLPDSRRLLASEEAGEFRDAIYADLMKAIALNANDPQAAYCARIFDNYFWRFCILIFLLKNWRDLREARDNDHLQTWFLHNKVDTRTAKEAWYLCQYYYENTRPFLKQLTEGSKLDEERKILRFLQKDPLQEMGHSRLLCKTRMPSRDFRKCIESLIERQAILCHEETGYHNKVGLKYTLNPVLEGIDIS